MDTPKSELLIPFIRSCKKESVEPIEGVIKGRIPEWLKGTLIRNGSGLLQVGPDQYNHIFDGLALLHRFSIQNGRITYQNRFLRSDSYRKNTAANRIVMSEFGTRGAPDPCKTIFQRMSSLFSMEELTDNDLVNVVKFTDEYYACTETNFIWKFDPETLESLEKVNLSNFVPVRTATAHTHEGKDGTVYNIGIASGRGVAYAIMKFPPKETSSSSPFAGGSVVSRIPATRSMHPSYHHSFGMSDNYFVVLEQSLQLSLPKLLMRFFSWGVSSDALQWHPQQKSRFFVVRRDNGTILPLHFLADAIAVFHFINVYEEDDQLIVDMCCYDDGKVVKDLYVQALRDYANDPEKVCRPLVYSQAKRYVLPLSSQASQSTKDKNVNLVRIPGCNAKALLQEDGSMFCQPETIAKPEPWMTEFPRINYDFNGKKYRYFYAVGRRAVGEDNYLVKVNTEDGTSLSWSESDAIPSEPVFVPDDSNEEDGGVVVASLLFKSDDKKVSLLVLDAKTMAELGRSDFVTDSSVPADFHGIFVKD